MHIIDPPPLLPDHNLLRMGHGSIYSIDECVVSIFPLIISSGHQDATNKTYNSRNTMKNGIYGFQ